MKTTAFGISLAIVLVIITTILPVSAQSPFPPSEVLPSVQDYLQIASASVTNQTGGQLMNVQINTMGNIPTTSDDEDEYEGGIGFGYGVLSTKKIIESHGGKIWAENNHEGGGVAFSFSLPADE